jgi:hypothetical protein
MSIIPKKVTGGEYVYFQTSKNGRKYERFIGRADNPETWSLAWKLYLEHTQKKIEKYKERINELMTERDLKPI